jgi:hypothetical protein
MRSLPFFPLTLSFAAVDEDHVGLLGADEHVTHALDQCWRHAKATALLRLLRREQDLEVERALVEAG